MTLGKAGRFYELTKKGERIFKAIPKTQEGTPDFRELRRLAKDRPIILNWVDHYEAEWQKSGGTQT